MQCGHPKTFSGYADGFPLLLLQHSVHF